MSYPFACPFFALAFDDFKICKQTVIYLSALHLDTRNSCSKVRIFSWAKIKQGIIAKKSSLSKVVVDSQFWRVFASIYTHHNKEAVSLLYRFHHFLISD